MPKPILPTRVFPAGTPLPAPATAPSAPPAPPPPPRPPVASFWPPPPPEPAPVVVHVHVLLPEVVEPEEPSWSWDRIWGWCQPRRNALGIALGFVPGIAWGRELSAARTEASISGAWVLAGLALLVTLTADRWRRRWYSRAAVWAAAIGAYAMASPFDIVTLFTGVHL